MTEDGGARVPKMGSVSRDKQWSEPPLTMGTKRLNKMMRNGLISAVLHLLSSHINGIQKQAEPPLSTGINKNVWTMWVERLRKITIPPQPTFTSAEPSEKAQPPNLPDLNKVEMK